MDGAELRVGRIAGAAVFAALLVGAVVATSFGLLRHWRLPAGGQGGSAALVAAIPAPRLQSAPQLERAVAETRAAAQAEARARAAASGAAR